MPIAGGIVSQLRESLLLVVVLAGFDAQAEAISDGGSTSVSVWGYDFQETIGQDIRLTDRIVRYEVDADGTKGPKQESVVAVMDVHLTRLKEGTDVEPSVFTMTVDVLRIGSTRFVPPQKMAGQLVMGRKGRIWLNVTDNPHDIPFLTYLMMILDEV